MMRAASSWFASRAPREQLLLQIGAVVALLAALWFGWQAANSYRTGAAADLASAMQLRDDVARLRATPTTGAGQVTPAASDGTPRGAASAIATQFGLSPSRIEPDGPSGIRISFEPASARSVYGWIDAVERAGFSVNRITIVRAGEGDLVQGDASLSAGRT
jgi:type II secretory pathway component PulM